MPSLLRSSAALVWLAVAGAASAATLTVTADKDVYSTGDTITLTVTGDSQGETSTGIFGRLLFSDPSLAAISTGAPTRNPLTGGGLPWLRGVRSCNSFSCDMMNDVGPLLATPSSLDGLLQSQVSFLALRPGSMDVAWVTDWSTGFQLQFFGVTGAPGTSFSVIGDPIVPDPVPPPPVLPPIPPSTGGAPGSGTLSPPANPGGGTGGTGGHSSEPIPEPSAALLFALGVACVRWSVRRPRSR